MPPSAVSVATGPPPFTESWYRLHRRSFHVVMRRDFGDKRFGGAFRQLDFDLLTRLDEVDLRLIDDDNRFQFARIADATDVDARFQRRVQIPFEKRGAVPNGKRGGEVVWTLRLRLAVDAPIGRDDDSVDGRGKRKALALLLHRFDRAA